ncbi:MAG: gliding motility lipoprotein GldD [Bacteroidota bacterium]
MHSKYIFGFLVCTLLFLSCKEDVFPKPKGMLRLEYPEAETKKLIANCNYIFEYSELANLKIKDDCSITLDYPRIKGSIFLSYKKVDGDLVKLLSDAQKLSYEHVVKADGIVEQPFLNEQDRVYGMFYDVAGNAASQSQFYVTDSVNHFITGSLYFYAKPNYDSIYPAAVYLQRDIRRLMETLQWKD